MVFGLVSAIAGLVKVRLSFESAVIDNAVFRLHYRATAALLFVACIVISANDLIGKPIQCLNDGGVPENVMNTYCWIQSTFTIPGASKAETSHPGVGPDTGKHDRVYHAYYQWVPFMLFLQGILFYLPHWIWKMWEQKRLGMISEGLRGTVLDNKEKKIKQDQLVSYLNNTLRLHNFYAGKYFLCEFLNFINVVGNIYFLDLFLCGAFLKYGIRVIEFSRSDQTDRTDPMIEVFPRVTKCTFHKYGPSGSIQPFDAQCIMALNILSEKIYIFLWFWFVILSIVTGMALVYRTIVICYPPIRTYVLQQRTRLNYPSPVLNLLSKLQYGDFFLINMLGKNMDILVYKYTLEQLTLCISEGRENLDSINANKMEMGPMLPKKESGSS